MKPDAIIEVRFKTMTEGGRQGAIVGEFYGCPLFVDGKAFDCRLSLDGKTLPLGETYELAVKFMNPDHPHWADSCRLIRLAPRMISTCILCGE